MNWNTLTEESQLGQINELSDQKAVLIFKHSTRCSISSAAKDRIERNWKKDLENSIEPFYLDLISYRSISNKIAENYKIEHQSPQILVIKNGEVQFSASHMAINISDIVKNI